MQGDIFSRNVMSHYTSGSDLFIQGPQGLIKRSLKKLLYQLLYVKWNIRNLVWEVVLHVFIVALFHDQLPN